MLPIREYCECYHIETSFVSSLEDFGLVQLRRIDQDDFLEEDQLRDLEKIMRLHYDLHINMEGIDAIQHLLNRVSQLQKRVRFLENRLRRYEE